MAKITGVGKYVPPRIVKNQDLEAMMETSDEWIRQRTGIEERRWADPGMSTSSMAHEASLAALKDAGKGTSDIDAIIFATLSPDYCFPGCGVLLQNTLCPGRPIPALDIRNQCSGFIYSLSVADAWIRAGMYKCVLVVGSELHSTGLDKTTEGRDISVLFGDGAGAVILEPAAPGEGILTTQIYSEGQFAPKLWMQKPSSSDFPRMQKGDTHIGRDFFPEMDGKYVFKHAVVRMCESIHASCASIGVTPQDIDFVLAHQANLRINNMVMQELKIPENKTLNTLQKYGNTTAATIPIGIEEAKKAGLLKKGQLVAFVAFGSGFTWGSSLVRWT